MRMAVHLENNLQQRSINFVSAKYLLAELVAMARVVVDVDANQSIHDSLNIGQRQLHVLPRQYIADPVLQEDVVQKIAENFRVTFTSTEN